MNKLNNVPAGNRSKSDLMSLSGVDRRLNNSVEYNQRSKHLLRMGLQGRFTLVVLGVVMLIMIVVAWFELKSGPQLITLASGKQIDLTNLETFQEQLSGILFLLRTPVIALVAAGFVMLFYTSRSIVAPLKYAGEVADAIAGGDLTRRISYPSNDEIGDLINSFNTMTGSLVRKVDQLASLNQAGHAFSGHLSLENLGDSIEENVREHVKPAIVGLYTIDSDELEPDMNTEDLKRAGAEEGIRERAREIQDECARKVLQSENLCLVFDGETDVRTMSVWTGERSIRTLGLPLFSEGHAFGSLTLTAEQSAESFSADDIDFLKTLASHVSVAARNAQLYRSLEVSYLDTVSALAAAVDAKDAYTRGHSERVMRNSVHLARAVGLPIAEVEMIRYSALLHDVGKIGLPTHILSTKEKLTEEEFNLVKQHPVIGYEIVKPISFLRSALDGILYHHERWEGNGYPKGLGKEEIPFMARLLALGDTWDAMAHDRFYRRARSIDEIIQEFRDCSGTQFDPSLVPLAIDILPAATAPDRSPKTSIEESVA
ncbi:HD domain-containing phosphohydrolase [Candidatus Zixiibacteriota bacterium]